VCLNLQGRGLARLREACVHWVHYPMVLQSLLATRTAITHEESLPALSQQAKTGHWVHIRGLKGVVLASAAKTPDQLPFADDPALKKVIQEAIDIGASIHYKRGPPLRAEPR
jgi:hypothetical protein